MGGLSYAAVAKCGSGKLLGFGAKKRFLTCRYSGSRAGQPQRAAPSHRKDNSTSTFAPLRPEASSSDNSVDGQPPSSAQSSTQDPAAADATAPALASPPPSPTSIASYPENISTQEPSSTSGRASAATPDPESAASSLVAGNNVGNEANVMTHNSMRRERIQALLASPTRSVSSVASCPGNIATFTHILTRPRQQVLPSVASTAQTTLEHTTNPILPRPAEQINTLLPPPVFQVINPYLEQQHRVHQEVLNRLPTKQVAHSPMNPPPMNQPMMNQQAVAGLPSPWHQQVPPSMIPQQYHGPLPARGQQWVHRDMLLEQSRQVPPQPLAQSPPQPVQNQQPLPTQIPQPQQLVLSQEPQQRGAFLWRDPQPQPQPTPPRVMQQQPPTPPQQRPVQRTPRSSFHEQQMWVWHQLRALDEAGFRSPPHSQPAPDHPPQQPHPAAQQYQNDPWAHYQLAQQVHYQPPSPAPSGPSRTQTQPSTSTSGSPSSASTTATLEQQLRLDPSELSTLRLLGTPTPPYEAAPPSPRHPPLPSPSGVAASSDSASTTDPLAGYANSPEHTHTYPVQTSPSNSTSSQRITRTDNPAALVGVYTRQLARTEEMISATRTRIMGLFGTAERVQTPAWTEGFEVLRECLTYKDYCLGMLRMWEERVRGREEEKREEEEVASLGKGSVKEEDESGEKENEGDEAENAGDERESMAAVATAIMVQNVSEETNNTGEDTANDAERAPWEDIPDSLMARWRARQHIPSADQASYQGLSPALRASSAGDEDSLNSVSSVGMPPRKRTDLTSPGRLGRYHHHSGMISRAARVLRGKKEFGVCKAHRQSAFAGPKAQRHGRDRWKKACRLLFYLEEDDG
ncbi:hypothetical protein QBC34DRAFT_58443 [Podospora aff. communis PSN243]|uniref:Uncharacterized protein n=1 Tax=Podospora aff. communis PSN243 TaxID=3040156 RepID=A0AAV9GRU3_9PEZI|nr:hypothetical protein QBC34DRAFT_58443 [Podospora aff. communis PSN243]